MRGRRWFYILLTIILDTEADEHRASVTADTSNNQSSKSNYHIVNSKVKRPRQLNVELFLLITCDLHLSCCSYDYIAIRMYCRIVRKLWMSFTDGRVRLLCTTNPMQALPHRLPPACFTTCNRTTCRGCAKRSTKPHVRRSVGDFITEIETPTTPQDI